MNEIKFYLKCISVGILTGIIIIVYRLLLKRLNLFREDFFSSVGSDISFLFLFFIILFVLLSGIFLGYILKKYPLTSGGGIVFIKADVEKNIQMSSQNKLILKDTIYKLAGALLALASGLPFGIEGPSVQLGAESGQGIGNFTQSPPENKKYLVASGAAAGLAAAFNAPLTGIFFAVEQVIDLISYKYLTAILITTTTVGWMVNQVFGTTLFFHVAITQKMETRHIYLIVIFAFFISLMGKLFFKLLNFFKSLNSRLKIHYLVKQCIPLTLGILASFIFFQVTGEGYELANSIIEGDYTVPYLIAIFFLKFIFFTYAASTGIPGGAFVPLIACGTILGKLFGTAAHEFFHFPLEYTSYFILLGMCLLLTSVVHAPITGIILISEITGINNQFYPLALGTICVVFFSKMLKVQSMYDEGLKNYMATIPNTPHS